MREPVAFLVKLSWPDGPEHNNDTSEQVAAIRDAIECLCGVESVTELEKPYEFGQVTQQDIVQGISMADELERLKNSQE